MLRKVAVYVGMCLFVSPAVWAQASRVLSETLPNVKPGAVHTLKLDSPHLVQLRPRNGWKLNPQAPSWLALFKKTSSGQFEFVQQWSKAELVQLKVLLPKLQDQSEYRLQGTFYICEKEKASFCEMMSRDESFEVRSGEGKARSGIELDLG